MSDENPTWQFFATLQRESDPQSIDRSLARDEALDVVLDEIIRNPATDKDLLRKRFCSLRRNRLSKQNNRHALLRRRFRGTQRRGGAEIGNVLLTVPTRTVFDRLAYKELSGLISTVLSEEEFRLLLEIAEGESYSAIARDFSTTVSGVKSKAFRIRQKVRKSRISAALQG
jgi:hypothetical protein